MYEVTQTGKVHVLKKKNIYALCISAASKIQNLRLVVEVCIA